MGSFCFIVVRPFDCLETIRGDTNIPDYLGIRDLSQYSFVYYGCFFSDMEHAINKVRLLSELQIR